MNGMRAAAVCGERRGRPRRRRPDRDRRPPRGRRRAGADPRRRRRGAAPAMLRGVLRGRAARLRLGRARRVRDRRCRPHRVPVPPCRGPRPSLRRGRRRAPRRARLAAARPPRLGAGRGRVCARGRRAARAASRGAGRRLAGRPRRAALTLPAETVERCRTVLREVGLVPGEVAAARVDLEASPTYRAAQRAGRALVRLSPRPGGLGRSRSSNTPPLTCGYGNGAAQRRSRAARPSSGRAARPDLGVQPERRRRSRSGQRSTTPASITAASGERAARSSSTIRSPLRRSAPS